MLNIDLATIVFGIWNVVVSSFLGLAMFNVKNYSDEQKRLSILLNRTREEIARDNVTQAEVERITDHIDQRFNRLEAKIDQLIGIRMVDHG